MDFEEARERGLQALGQGAGIGTLRERSLHAVLKWLLMPDERYHEVPLNGYVADCFDGEQIIEVQTVGLHPLQKKLAALLLLYPVTVVVPIIREKRLIWTQPDSGETTTPRRSPKRGRFLDALPELFWLLELIPNERLTVRLWEVDVEEYRLLDGWGNGGKRGSHRAERLPTAVGDSLWLRTPADYAALLPPLPVPFTAADFAKATHLSGRRLWQAMKLLEELAIIRRVGKKGNAYLYARVVSEDEAKT